MFLVVCLAAAVIFLLYLRWEYSTYVKTIDLIPGPPKIPVMGNALLIPRNPHGKKPKKQKQLFFLIFQCYSYDMHTCSH